MQDLTLPDSWQIKTLTPMTLFFRAVTKKLEGITMAVTAALVKELRERTGAGMMDCKKALN